MVLQCRDVQNQINHIIIEITVQTRDRRAAQSLSPASPQMLVMLF